MTPDDFEVPTGTADAPATEHPLSLEQRRLWFLDRWTSGTAAYNVPLRWTLDGPVDSERLVRALRSVLVRYDALFTAFRQDGDEPVQRVLADRAFPLSVVDAGEETAERLLAEAAAEPFDLQNGPLVRATLCRVGPRRVILGVVCHHIAFDGWSFDILDRELMRAYTGEDPADFEQPNGYLDYAAWQRGHTVTPEARQRLAEAAGELRDLPDLIEFNRDFPRPAEISYRGRTLSFTVDTALAERVSSRATELGVTPFVVLLASFQTLVHRESGSADVVLGTPFAARLEPHLQHVVGLFTRTLVLTGRLARNQTFADVVDGAREGLLHSLARADIPFESLVEAVRPERTLSHGPLVQTQFAYHEANDAVNLPDGLRVERRVDATDTAKFDISWSVYHHPAGFRVDVEYTTDLYERSTVERLFSHWCELLRAALAEPGTAIGELPLASVGERGLVAAWSGAETGPVAVSGVGSVHGLVGVRAVALPGAVAVSGGGGSLTYAGLEGRANRIARGLGGLGVGREARVGVCWGRSVPLVPALLGVLKAGAAYVPLDGEYPAERLAFVLADAGVEVVLVEPELVDRIPEGPWRVVPVGEDTFAEQPATDPGIAVSPDQTAYVIYTSGSTGRPKGVAVSHHNVVRLLSTTTRDFTFRENDVWPLFHSFTFDVSVWEMWGALSSGGRLVMVPYTVSRDPEAFHALVREEGVTVLNQTPSAFAGFEAADRAAGLPLRLRYVVFAGEALDHASVRRWSERHGWDAPALINMYGITETTVHSTFLRLSKPDLGRALTQIGRPLADLSLHVLDESGAPCPLGVTGEIYVGGPGVTRGYVGRPDLTAERFVPDHVSGVVGARLYRSGDLARMRPGGGLEYVGRADAMVNVRGFRVELGEVEAVLGSCPGVAGVAVVTRDDGDGVVLVAYLVAGVGGVSVPEVREWAEGRLPRYMVPSRWMVLDALPLTSSGKVDRRVLPVPEAGRVAVGEAFVAPVGVVEERLAAVWSQVLGVERVGRHDRFFDLGGDSIRSIRVVGLAREAGLELVLQDLFRAPTVAELALVTRAAGDGGSGDDGVVEPFALIGAADRKLLPEDVVDAYPMTALQLGMVYEMERDPERLPYHNVTSFQLHGPFEADRLTEAVALAVARHPIWRTSFSLSGYSEPLQLVHPAATMPLAFEDLRDLPTAEQDRVVRAYVNEQRRRPFDNAVPPLFRMFVHRRSGDVFQWTLTEHHAVLDGWSLHTTLAEILENYRILLAGGVVRARALRSSFRDFVALEREAAGSEASRAFWAERLTDRPDIRLSRWPSNAGETVGAGERVENEWHYQSEPGQGYGAVETLLPEDLCRGLEALAQRCGVPLKSVLLAAYLRTVGFVTGSQDVLVGVTANGRVERVDGDEVRGLFLNTLPFRLGLPDGSWSDLIQAVFRAERDMLPHRRYPLAALQREFTGGIPIEANFVYNHFHVMDRALSKGTVHIQDGKIDSFTTDRAEPTNFPLNVGILRSPSSSRLLLGVDYHTDRLTTEQVLFFRGYLVRALREMVAGEERFYLRDSLASVGERGLVAAWSGAETGPVAVSGVGSVHGLVGVRAVALPGAVAVSGGGGSLTYAGLEGRANRIARGLGGLGVGREARVGVCWGRSVPLVPALLGVLKAGAAYVPLDGEYPAERLAFVLADAGVEVVLVEPELVDRIPEGPWRVVPVGEDTFAEQPATDPGIAVSPDQTAYVIYTSGSTGRPKGVAVSHAAVVDLLRWGTERHRFGTDDVWTLFHSTAFDFSVWEMWGALSSGGRLVVVSHPVSRDPEAFHALVREEGVTVLNQTPSAFAGFEAADRAAGLPLPLRLVIFGGEALDHASVRRWSERHGWDAPALINMYGITETTVHVTERVLSATDLLGTGTQIGNAVAGLTTHVLDQAGVPVPLGTVGEVFVGGSRLARGYVGRPDLTAERFVPDHVSGVVGARLYRSGDLARMRPGGGLEYVGRADAMVNVRGFRVELGEVEAVLGSCPGVAGVAVVTRDDGDGVVLVAYLVAGVGGVSVPEVREWAEGRLPRYMVPSRWMVLDALPLTSSGKVDRRVLPVPEAGRVAVGEAFVAPVGVVEERLAAVWSQVLGVERVGRHDRFFDLGGDSIRSIRVVGLAREAGLELVLQDLFRAPTVAELALVTRAAGDGGSGDDGVVEPFALIGAADRKLLPEDVVDAYPMTALQLGMVYEMERDPERLPYHNVTSVIVRMTFDEKVLREALAVLITRHPVLRTSFAMTDFDEPLQLVHATVETPLLVVDTRAMDADERRATVRRELARERRTPFDIRRPSMVRFLALPLTDDVFHLALVDHHAVLDGWSVASTLAEVVNTYLDLLAGGVVRARALRSSFRDFVALEREAAGSEASRAFWAERLTDRPDIRLSRWPSNAGEPCAKEEPFLDEWRDRAEPGQGYGAVETLLPEDLCRGLEALAQRCDVPLKSVLLAAYLRTVGFVTGSQDVLVGVTANGRVERVDGDEVRGLFLNTLPFRLGLPDGSWSDLIQAVFRAERDMLPHRRYPLAALQREFTGGIPIEANFVYNHFHVIADVTRSGMVEVPSADAVGEASVQTTNLPFLVGFVGAPQTGRLALEIQYRSEELGEAQVTSFSRYLVRALREMVAGEERFYLRDSLASVGERGLVAAWSGAETGPVAVSGVGSVHGLVGVRAVARPGAVAVSGGGGSLTYAGLEGRANRIARGLGGLGVGREARVGVCWGRSVPLVPALLGVLKAGAAYVPLDGEYPAERLAFVLADAGVEVVLVEPELVDRIPEGPWRVVPVGEDTFAEQPATDPGIAVSPDQTAYVIYTSGSTGRPKGVLTTHRNVVDLLGAPALALTADDRLLHNASIAFDVATWELWAPLVAGGELVLPAEPDITTENLSRWVREHEITVLHLTASLFRLTAEKVPEVFDRVRMVLTGSEVISPDHVRQMLARHHQLVVVNCWGPTETTTFTVCQAFGSPDDVPDPAPLGRPIGGAEVFVLDERLMPVPPSVIGEIHVAGPSLARGYAGRPDLTAERFLPDHLTGTPGGRLYRTGDRGAWSGEGLLEFHGRTDSMVKVRGFRVEPAEVEAALSRIPGVGQAVVLSGDDPEGGTELRAYLTPADGSMLPTDASVRAELSAILPGHLVPAVLVPLDEIPMNANGKADRAALRDLGRVAPGAADRVRRAPETGLQRYVADLWARTLGVPEVSLDDSFVSLGGHSLLALRVLFEVRKQLLVSLPPGSLIRSVNLEEFAGQISAALEEKARSGEFDGILDTNDGV
ncbi:amino acid adenylation domain-containing protein [Streptomyces sp. JH002]|uniref:non-ribosomal peptide synthetase n=1 Tax=Streptomyces sp. JH002 TaxID=2763259 RepID=UPI003D804DBB